ncbi:DUF1963 domain-containing protein [Pseudomonas allokribbensis]|uniref:DUF1963 domain-containing protein n=1 Tax=Pseudomonas allokribbensis TaxID=2774460 RepID=UPI00178875C5|nr:DUF1963 domain-containing protein [Pseudomonas allokribbensis]
MFNELVFSNGNPDKMYPFLGGNPYLPESIAWPTDSTGAPLLHLASLSAAFINRYIPQVQISEEIMISLFTPYSVSSDSYINTAMNEGGKVLAYRPSNRQVDGYGKPIFPSLLITAIENTSEDSDENGVAKIAGIPAWIQDDESRDDLTYVLQINNSRLNKAAPSHKSIFVGGMGYLLLKRNIVDEDLLAGELVIQVS